MEIKNKAAAGTLESSDIYVVVEPNENGIDLHLESIVYNQFNEEIEKAVRDVLNDFNVENIKIQLKDRGAVECAIRARVETALKRAGGVNS
ncbi:citrate lyase acyl carrier protein [Sedimentibacter hydroxybenzoicus DSM 7310]|uniref:Citrate lyase acyl carrier protein n=1 Tax=Sedimentibacter hydroxybenzoicus DSM 7310 TaxID=1123245 RepID=A0A974BIS4_SEDHY|nr:citrate lyase acyl carrier protein [Sedimentibacter hydroxybenzoicus]NYB73666.1 citrate lyase acyl carrier protein [Sedimentibacter hydroxybenzoicus DSM 7310]